LSLRVGFDLDGVFADMDSALVNQAQSLFGDKLASREPGPAVPLDPTARGGPDPVEALPVPGQLHLTPRQQRRLWRHIATIDNFWMSLREIEPGAVKRLGAVAAARRWEVIFLTKRPATAGLPAQVQSQRWLVSKGFERPSVFVVQGSRGLIASALDLDVVVDDRHENCYDVVVDSDARALLVWREGGRQFLAAAERLGVEVFGTVGECLDILTRPDSPVRP
jgi:hypothetical protein